MPAALRAVPVRQRAEVARVVAEHPPGIAMGRLTTVLGLILAIAEYAERTTLRCGLAVIKRRLLRALEASGLRFHEIARAHPVYPRDGPMAGYFFAHPDPAALIYWFADEVGPAVRKALELRLRAQTLSTVVGEHP